MSKLTPKRAGDWMKQYMQEQHNRSIPAPGYKTKRIYDIRAFVKEVWDEIRRFP